MSTKVVYNACFGGFSLSPEAVRLAKSKAPEGSNWHNVEEEFGFIDLGEDEFIYRHDKILVEVVEELGDKAHGSSCSELAIVEIREDIYWINEEAGKEKVETMDKTKWISVED